MIRLCTAADVPQVFATIIESAEAYKGVIYWNIPDRQLETSVVLAHPRWGG